MGRRRRLLFFFLLQSAILMLATSTASSHANAQGATTEGDEEGVGAMLRRKTTLGSRPPSCEGRCRSSCGRRCEAVQVPVTPHDLLLMLRDRKKKKKKTLREAGAGSGGGRNHGGAGGVLLPSSYDDHSNYKPLGWRCKCLHS